MILFDESFTLKTLPNAPSPISSISLNSVLGDTLSENIKY